MTKNDFKNNMNFFFDNFRDQNFSGEIFGKVNEKLKISKFQNVRNFEISDFSLTFPKIFFPKKCGPKKFENFSNPNFENKISPRIFFLPKLFSSKGMIIYFVLRMFSASSFTTGGEPQGYSEKIH